MATQAATALGAAQRAFLDSFVPAARGHISVIATDIDGTLTDPNALLRAQGIAALEHLRAQPVPPLLMPVTGRPAAAVQGLLIYTGFAHCPIIAENGAVVVPHAGAAPHVVAPFKDRYEASIRAYLADVGIAARPTDDTDDRVADITFIPPAEGPPAPAALRELAEAIDSALRQAPRRLGLPATQVVYSSVHVHVGPAGVSKGDTLRRLLAGELVPLPGTPLSEEHLVCLGDSANDASLFSVFPERAVAIPIPGPALHPGLASRARYAAPAVADEGFAAVVQALFPPPGHRPAPC